MNGLRPVNPGRLFESQLASAVADIARLAPRPGEPFDPNRSLKLDKALVVAEEALRQLRNLRGEP